MIPIAQDPKQGVRCWQIMSSYAKLMGAPKAHLDSGVFAFSDDKRYQLLAYLAHRGDWVNREELAYVFWPEVGSSTARKDLRHLLGRVRGLAWLNGSLEAQGERLRWPVQTDVQRFLKAATEARWEQALELYGGVFLEGFSGAESPEFSAWLQIEREHLQNHWRTALFKQAEALEYTGKPLEASQLLEKLLKHDEFDEEALKAYMLAAVRSGQRGQALKVYGKFSERLLEELDLRPTVVLEQLAQSIRDEDPTLLAAVAPVSTAPPKTRSLPMPATPFVGRDLLLGEIAHILADSQYRLLTLTGPGGVGKTRLALQTALEHQQHFRQGVYFVSLVALSSPISLAPAIAEAIGFSLEGKEPLGQIAGHIGEKHMLLVLDNFEHLAQAAPQVAQLLRECPNLWVLATSRVRLGLEAEQVLPIEGFPLPTDPAQALHSDAVRLFALRVQRLRPGFKPQASNLTSIVEICRLVEGFPLGIELAAVWMRALPIEAIVWEIGQNMDFLQAEGDVAARHQSIRAAFEHSWRLLTPEEQEALKRLSVFRGGFEREAAKLAAGVSLPVLASLIDKSLIYTGGSGRYFRHALLYQYMQEKLSQEPQQERAAQAEHGGYYLRFLQRCLEGIRGPDPMSTFAAMKLELENLRMAWQWAAQEAKVHLLGATAEALMRFCDAQKRYQDGIEIFAEAIAKLDQTNPEHQAALGTLLVHQAKMHERLGHFDAAEQLTHQALALLRPLKEFEPIIWGLGTLGTNAAVRGNHTQSLAYREEALSLANAIHNERLIAVCYGWLAISEDHRGNYPQAKHSYREAIHLFRKLGNRIGALYNLNNLAQLTLDLGELEEARSLLQQALEQAKATDTRSLMAEILMRLGNCYHKLGDYPQAQQYSREALELAKEDEDPPLEIELHLTLSEIALAKGENPQAKQHLSQALDQAWRIQDLPLVMKALIQWAEYLWEQGKIAQVPGLLRLVSDHAATLSVEKDRIQKLLISYAMASQAEPPSLEEVVKQLLYS